MNSFEMIFQDQNLRQTYWNVSKNDPIYTCLHEMNLVRAQPVKEF